MRRKREATGRELGSPTLIPAFHLLSFSFFFDRRKAKKMLASRPLTGFAQAALKGRYVSLIPEFVTLSHL